MRQKGVKEIIILAAALVAVFSVYFIFKSDQRAKLLNTVNNPIRKVEQKIVYDKNCAAAGEEPVNNFDYTTGKIDTSIPVIKCCTELKEIQKKQVGGIKRSNSGDVICETSVGGPNSICSPCGNGKCDTNDEDICNCPEDCEE